MPNHVPVMVKLVTEGFYTFPFRGMGPNSKVYLQQGDVLKEDRYKLYVVITDPDPKEIEKIIKSNEWLINLKRVEN